MPTLALKEHYVGDEPGNRVAVFPAIEDYSRLMEELGSLRPFDGPENSGEKPIPFEQAVAEIERHGR